MKTVVIRVDPERRQWWKSTMSALLPAYKVVLWDEDKFEKSDISYAIVWAPPKGMLASLPNLKGIFSVGAGISHITEDETLPPNVPIIRTTGPALRQRMSEYIALHVLRIHRRLPEIERAARSSEWRQFVEPVAAHFVVGIMGMGNLGSDAARTLKSLGYQVKGLTRNGRTVDGLQSYSQAQLPEFLKDLNVVISMLPGTKETANIINAGAIAHLPKGAWVINVGRGSQVDDEALLHALEADHLAGAVLDVFRKEPLPAEHPFWKSPKILITSHTASAIEPSVGGEIIARNLLDFDAGKDVKDKVDLAKGY